jgi:c-di-GMP-binding flagellar brake protein YcgR
MSRYLRLNPTDLARIFHPQAQLELSFNIHSNPTALKELSLVAKVAHWSNDQIVLTLPPNVYLTPEEAALLTVGQAVMLQTGGDGGSNKFICKISVFDLPQKQLVVGIPRIMTSSERRRSQRAPFTVAITYHVLKLDDRDLTHLSRKIGKGVSQDLSCHGLTMTTGLFLPIGLTLALKLKIERETLTARAIVRRVKALDTANTLFATSVKFIEPSPEFQSKIAEIIAKSTDFFKKKVLL